MINSTQSISSLNTGDIVELECLQSFVTNTFVTVSMERDEVDAFNQRTLVHRSINMGQTWAFDDSFAVFPGDETIADPVITCDKNGDFFRAHAKSKI